MGSPSSSPVSRRTGGSSKHCGRASPLLRHSTSTPGASRPCTNRRGSPGNPMDLPKENLFDAWRYTPEQIAGYKADNERRVRSAARHGDVFVDGQPLKLTLELTADCNLYCRMCEFPVPRERGRGRYDMDMPLETFRMLVPQVFPHARIVNLTVVGEPLMVPY